MQGATHEDRIDLSIVGSVEWNRQQQVVQREVVSILNAVPANRSAAESVGCPDHSG